MMKNVLLLILFSLISATITAQQIISSAGTFATGKNAQLTWTVGEPVISTLPGNTVMLTQGFNQGNLLISAVEPIEINGITFKVFPNPVADILQIKLSDFTNSVFSYCITDVNSRILMEGKIDQNPQPVEMKRLAQGVYFLGISKINPPKVQTFKIVKQ